MLLLLLALQPLFTSDIAEPGDIGLELDATVVRSVKDGSIASKSGLQAKDRILEHETWADLIKALRARPVDIEFALKIRRKEMTRDVVVRLFAPRKVEDKERFVALRTTKATIAVKGRTREYEMLAPKGGDKRPLLMMLHGTHSSAQYVMAHWAPLARDEAILVAPQSSDGKWDPFGDDSAFVDALLDELLAKHPVDAARVYVAGHSSGGMFASYLASMRGDRFAAAGCFASHLAWNPETASKRRPPVLLYLGEKDKLGSPERRSVHAKALREAGHAVTVVVEMGGLRGPDFHDMNDRGSGVIWEWLRRQRRTE